MWMIDGGSSVHLLRKSDLSDIEAADVGRARNRMSLIAADGVIVADKSLQLSLSKINLDGEAYVTDSAPAGIGVLSQGETVRENKCSYWWRPVEGRDDISICTMYMPGSNQSIGLHIEDDVPMLNSAVVAVAIKHHCFPNTSSARSEKVDVDKAPSRDNSSDATTNSPDRSRRKEPNPHQARQSEAPSQDSAGVYTDSVIEIFAGTAGLAGCVKARGHIIYTFDTNMCRN